MMLALQHRDIAPGEGHAVGRALLREMTESLTGRPMPDIHITQRGKPYFTSGNLHFSITHTKRHVFCALSDAPIGIDAEEVDRNISPALAAKILSDSEYHQYENAPDHRLALLTFWVLKEAQAKYDGTGLQGYPNHTNFTLDDPRVICRDGCFLAVIQKEETHAF